MAVRVWLHKYEAERLHKYELEEVEHYLGEGEEELVTTEIERTGVFSHLKSSFVLGKVRFWEKKGSKHRTPFVRVDNHCAYKDGLVLSPEDWIDIRFHHKKKTINQLTRLTRVQLLSAPDNDFIGRVFVTYNTDSLICKPTDLERHFLVYCDSQHLFNGCVSEKP